MYFNYWNDDFYLQWYHQLFFTVSELVSTCLVLRLADLQTPVTPLAVLPVVAVAAVHIMVANADQFVVNVVEGQGTTHQVSFSLAMIVGDLTFREDYLHYIKTGLFYSLDSVAVYRYR